MIRAAISPRLAIRTRRMGKGLACLADAQERWLVFHERAVGGKNFGDGRMAIDTRIIHPCKLAGKITAPPSKSVMQRLLAILLVRNASLIIHNAGHSADDEVAKKILTESGFVFNQLREGSLEVIAPAEGSRNLTTVNFGESGLAARMFIPILALRDTKIMLDAAPALRLRPMPFLNDVLPKLGVKVHSTNEGLPDISKGHIHPEILISMVRSAPSF